MNDLTAKPIKGPHWVKDAKVGEKYYFDGQFWQVTRTADRGREIHWYNTSDSRRGTTIVHPGHPDYPKDPTQAELKAEARAELARKRAQQNYY